jgi:alanine-synthesizing transaminase
MNKSKRIVPASRTAKVTYAVRDVVLLADEVAATGKAMTYLNIGDPNLYDFAPPAHVIDAVLAAMQDNRCGYSPSSGIASARDAIAADAAARGIDDIRDVFVTTGASEAIDLCIGSLLEVGDNILMPSPCYPLYRATVNKYGGKERFYRLDESNQWLPDLDDLQAGIDDRTRAIVLINPNNPTGAVIGEDVLRELVALAGEHNLVLFMDEIYDKLLLDDAQHISLASLTTEVPVITFGGISKSYLAPGFRLGWGIASGPADVLADYLEAINKLLRARLSANHPAQFAIAPALTGDQSHLDVVRTKLRRRRDLTMDMLTAIDGITCVRPGAAFYAFPKLDITQPDTEFVNGLIRQEGVVVVPGSGFGQDEGTQHIRVVYLADEATLEDAYRKIDRFMTKFRRQD